MSLTPEQRRERASKAGRASWANTEDRTGRAQHATRGNWKRFYRSTDPGLPDDVRRKQADAAYKASLRELSTRAVAAHRENAARRAAERARQQQTQQNPGAA